MSTFKHLNVSLEGIEFQNGAFFKELVLTLSSIPKENRARMKKDEFAQLGAQIDKVIERHVGLSTDVVWEDFDMNAYVMVPFIDLNSPIFLDLHKYFFEGTLGADEFVAKKGSAFKVNPKTSMITGDLTKEVFFIGAPKLTYINGKLTDEELAAIILHEVGHLFSMFECLDKTLSTNAILQELDQRLRNNPTPKERDVILEKAGKALNFERAIVEDTKKTTDNTVVLTIYVGQAIERIRTDSGQQFFDINTFETLADQFAVRHGAGKSIATGLDKMYNSVLNPGTTVGGTAKYLIFEVYKLIRLVVQVANSAALVFSGSLGFIVLGGLLLLITFYSLKSSNSGESVPTYATAFERFTRVRQQLVEQAKRLSNTIKPALIQKQLLQDIAAIDEVMKNYHDRQSWLDTMAAFVFSSVKTQQNNIKFQKQLEALALNDLYLQSLSLKNL